RGLLRHRRALPALLGLGERLERDEVGPEQLDGVTTAEPLGLHDPVDDAAAFLARAIAAPAVGLRRDAQGRRLGRTERAQTDDLISAALELHALGLGQPLEADLGVQALELVGRDAGHVALLRVCAAGSRTRPYRRSRRDKARRSRRCWAGARSWRSASRIACSASTTMMS